MHRLIVKYAALLQPPQKFAATSTFILLSYLPLHFWFSRNNSETVQVVTLAFSSDHQHFIRDIRTKFGVPNSPQSPGIGQNTDGCITDLRISGQSYYKRKSS